MRFAPLVLDLSPDGGEGGALTARVDDELYQGATAPFADLAKADRSYVRMLAERIVATWLGAGLGTGLGDLRSDGPDADAPLAPRRYIVRTSDALHEGGAAAERGDGATLAVEDGATLAIDDGAPLPLASVTPPGRAAIVRDLRNLMDVAQGILRIDGGVGAAQKQKRGEHGD